MIGRLVFEDLIQESVITVRCFVPYTGFANQTRLLSLRKTRAGCINAIDANEGMPAGAEALDLCGLCGTTQVVPCYETIEATGSRLWLLLKIDSKIGSEET